MENILLKTTRRKNVLRDVTQGLGLESGQGHKAGSCQHGAVSFGSTERLSGDLCLPEQLSASQEGLCSVESAR